MELEAWQYSALSASVTLAVFLFCWAYVESRRALSLQITYCFLKAHKSISSVSGAISDHWGQLATVASLFLGHTIIISQSTAVSKHSDDYPWTTAYYSSLTILGASCYATAVFMCVIHRTATSGLKEIALTKYVLSMPRCIGGPLLLNMAAWVVTDLSTTIAFMVQEDLAVSTYSFISQACCWSVVFYTAYWAFAVEQHTSDLQTVEERWIKLQEGHLEPDDDDEEDALHNVQGQEGWRLVTHTLANEITEQEEKSKKNSEFCQAIKDFVDLKHEECLVKLKKHPRNAPHDLIASFDDLRLGRQLAQ